MRPKSGSCHPAPDAARRRPSGDHWHCVTSASGTSNRRSSWPGVGSQDRHRLIRARRCDSPTIRRPGQGVDPGRVQRCGDDLPARGHLPDHGEAVEVPADQPLPVGTPRHGRRLDPVGPVAELPDPLALHGIEDVNPTGVIPGCRRRSHLRAPAIARSRPLGDQERSRIPVPFQRKRTSFRGRSTTSRSPPFRKASWVASDEKEAAPAFRE